MTIFEMKQNRAKIVTSMRELMDKFNDGVMDADAKASYAKMETDYDAISDKIDAEEKLLNRERTAGEQAKPDSKPEAKTDELFTNALTGDTASIRNALDLGTSATAGYLTAPVQFVEQLIKGLDNITFMRQISHVTPRLGQGQSLGYPYVATAASAAEWEGETDAAAEETTLTFGRREFKPNRLGKIIKLSRTLVSHANMAEAAVRDEMIRGINTALESAYMTGNGSGKPLGIFTASDSGIATGRDVAAAAATSVAANDFINAKYGLKQQYMTNASWVMHRDLVKAAALLKDTNGQYIWQQSYIEGQPDRLLGLPVHMSEYAPNTVTASKYVAVVGDFNYYWICDSDALSIQVLNELYAANNQIGYNYMMFTDGAPVVGEAFARLKTAAS